MSFFKNLLAGLGGLFRKKKVDQELDEELQAYLESAVAFNLERGMTQAEALRTARIELGSLASVKDQVHQAGWESIIEEFGRDLRYGARMLRRNPTVTFSAVLTLALGIGLNTGIFAILNGSGLRLLHVPDAEQLAVISQNFARSHYPLKRSVRENTSFFSYSEYIQYRNYNQVFTGLLAYAPLVFASLGGERPQRVVGTLVSCNYFEVLQVQPNLGRRFDAADCPPAGPSPLVILSDALWRTAFAADRNMVGKKVSLNRTSFRVIGIAAAGFQGTEPVQSQFWAPLNMQSEILRGYDYLKDDKESWLGLIGRVKPDTSAAQVRADLQVIAANIDQLQPGRVSTIEVGQATLFAVPEERTALFSAGALLLVAFGAILLIAGANVASLLLARAVVRRKEIAVKRALGANRFRLVRQLLTESLLLAIMGGALGAFFAAWFSGPFLNQVLSHLPAGTPPLALNASSDFRVLGYALGLSIVTGLAFGLAPALHATRADLSLAMKGEGAEVMSGSYRGGWLRSSLVGLQLAVCMILLICSGLFLRGLQRTYTFNPGFSMSNVVLTSFDLLGAGYSEESSARFRQQLVEQVSAIPGVDRVAQVARSPLGEDNSSRNYSVPGGSQDYQIEHNSVSPGYFALLHIPIVRGRDFTDSETSVGKPVVILTQSTARRLWPNEDPIGKTLLDGAGPGTPGLKVVGVVADAQVAHPGESPELYLYRAGGGNTLLARVSGDYGTIAKSIKMVVRDLDPELPPHVAKLEDNMEFWRSLSRILSALLSALGGLALFLASIGVYGMVSYAVSCRTREIGIRMALGASFRSVMVLVVRGSMRPVVVGALVGVACSAAVSSLLSSVLYGVSPWDPASFLLVPAFLLAVALCACYLPARKAARVDPVESLRCG
jgi:predicted permease